MKFEHVSFHYEEDAPAVSDLSFEAMPGETVALVGTTGSGKSTTLNLLTRFYEPSEGRILLDDKAAEIKSVSKSTELWN